MNRLTSRQRRFAYIIAIVLLLAPIVMLGMPAAATQMKPGKISQLRQQYKLGEATLGDVDPSSATMNLVLLGMRGLASAVLWMQADEQKEHKNFSELEQTVESIIKLQPRFLAVWKFQGWNLGYNVSAECDAVADRYFWVKKGAKFMQRGTRQNEDAAELYNQTGEFFGKKIGRSDEWKQFRQYFKSDPDPRWEGGPDEEINPDGQDNYLVAKDYYATANEKELLPGVEQHIMARNLFRSYPARSQMDYATALEREGFFGETAREAWATAHQEWTQDYGREFFDTPGGEVMLEASDDELRQISANDGITYEEKKKWQDAYQKMANYTYWRMRAEVESRPEMSAARRNLYEGKQEFFRQNLNEARTKLETGLTQLEGLVTQFPELLEEREVQEDIFKSIFMWHHTVSLLGEQIPDNFPMKSVWDDEKYVDVKQELQERFLQAVGGTFAN